VGSARSSVTGYGNGYSGGYGTTGYGGGGYTSRRGSSEPVVYERTTSSKRYDYV